MKTRGLIIIGKSLEAIPRATIRDVLKLFEEFFKTFCWNSWSSFCKVSTAILMRDSGFILDVIFISILQHDCMKTRSKFLINTTESRKRFCCENVYKQGLLKGRIFRILTVSQLAYQIKWSLQCETVIFLGNQSDCDNQWVWSGKMPQRNNALRADFFTTA